VAGFCGRSDEPSGSIKCREFLQQLRICYLLRKDSAPLSWLVSRWKYNIKIDFREVGWKHGLN
jgi:hypothetical protein